jgi:hypothetical protein
VEAATPMVWPLTVVGALLPALALLALVRSLANRLEPGYGTAAAITLGLATMVMTFASEYFPHLIAATLGFAAFAILWRERAGPPRPWLAAAAGLLAGLAVCFEYPLGLVGLILFGYVVSRRERRVPRAAGYAAGAVAGALPLFAFNLWAFGSPLTFAYGDAVAVQGTSGHALLGLNDDGVFGISLPSLEAALDLLLASRGLLTLTPIVAIAIAGTVQMRRRGHRAESNVVLAIAAAYFLYNAGYWLPFGGGTPGPRFLIPTLPFLALGLALAWRRWPGATLALAIPSALFMVTASLTYPLIGDIGTAVWAERLAGGDFEHTLLTALGIQESWLGIVPVLAALALAIGFAAAATPPTPLGGARLALALLAAWALLSAVGPSLADDAVTPLQGGRPTLALIGVGGLASLGALAALRRREQRARAAVQPRPVPAPALGERIS